MSDEDLQIELKLIPSETCPVCFDPESSSPPKLWKCLGCRALLCPNADCDVFKLDNPKRCFHHPGTVYCQSCVGPEDNPRLRPCPSEGCDRWTCHTDWKWCTGRRVVDAVSSITTESSDERPAKKVKVEPQPAHARRLAPCSNCLPSTGWENCSNLSCASSSSGFVCPDCCPNGGLECSGEHKWICDACSEEQFPTVWPCPSCEELFCFKCPDITRCFGCGRSELCLDCRAPDAAESTSHGDASSVDSDFGRFGWRCCGSSCDARLCETCAGKKEKPFCWECTFCSEIFCDECERDTCTECNGDFCRSHDECGCGGMGESTLEEFAAYDDDDYDYDFY